MRYKRSDTQSFGHRSPDCLDCRKHPDMQVTKLAPKKTCHLLGAVPFDEQVKLFSSWLRLVDVCRFDNALCGSADRKLYLDLISSNEMIMSERISCTQVSWNVVVVHSTEEQCVKWMLLRRIKVSGFRFPVNLSANHVLRERFLEHTGRSIEAIDLTKLSSIVDGVICSENKDVTVTMPCTADVLFDMAKHCTNLRELKMWNSVVDGTLAHLFTRCLQLQSVDLVDCVGVNRIIMHALFTSCPRPTQLNLSGCECFQGCMDLSGIVCTSLTMLDITNICRDDADRLALLRTCPNLTGLKMYGVTPDELNSISATCPKMTRFSARYIEDNLDECIPALASAWKSITHLKLSAEDDVVVFSAASLRLLIAECPTIQEIITTGYRVPDKHMPVDMHVIFGTSCLCALSVQVASAELFETIAELCPNLQYFGIVHPTNTANPDVVYPFEKLAKCPLRTLVLRNCLNVTAACIEKIHSLTAFHLCDWPGEDGDGLTALAQRCPQLKDLQLLYCANVTECAVRNVVRVCPELETLYHSRNRNIENVGVDTPKQDREAADEALQLVRRYCPNIKRLVIDGLVLLYEQED